MVRIEKAGNWSPGLYVRPIRDLNFDCKSNIFDALPKRGERYLIESCFDPSLREDMLSEDQSLQRLRLNHALMFANPRLLNYKIKLYGYEFIDKMGFDYYPSVKLFIPDIFYKGNRDN